MKDITVKPDINIRQAMKTLSQSGKKCLIIIDEKKVLLGTLSDGDVRKAILKGTRVGDSISDIYYQKPTVLVKGKYSIKDAKNIFTQNKFDLIPVVDEKGKLVDILFWESVFKNGNNRQNEKIDMPVVIMAGGKGTRLGLFTKVLPKPLVPIHEKTVIEHIIERFTDVGADQFILTINYKARIMKAYFEELNPDYSVNFVEESKPLGTAGSLKFLENKFDKPFMVSNCDIIIKTDYLDLYEFHQKNNFDITLVASMKNYTIPYGTCELNGEGHLKQINEKPEYDFLVNTGLYIINPDVLHLIPADKLYHITHLIEDAQKSGKHVGVYPIDDEAWIDVGQWADYQKAVDRL
jgi:dTDP-glucose pyrophosphorylase/predicted transcriptional regulator